MQGVDLTAYGFTFLAVVRAASSFPKKNFGKMETLEQQ
jgi:hypothetical protein